MNNKYRIAALKMVLLALDEVETLGGKLPIYDDPEESSAAPTTFLELVNQYAANRVEKAELIAVIDNLSPLFPDYQFPWK